MCACMCVCVHVCVCVCERERVCICLSACVYISLPCCLNLDFCIEIYGVATVSRIDKIIGFFCKRAL